MSWSIVAETHVNTLRGLYGNITFNGITTALEELKFLAKEKLGKLRAETALSAGCVQEESSVRSMREIIA